LKYGFGKTLSYTVIGALFGLVGSFITFTPFIKGVAAFVAGLFLVLFGLNMLGLFSWFRRFRFKTPGFVSKGRNSGPLMTGLLNGLMIACGPLQAMYILAAASGSMYYGALYMLVFGLGTLPVLLGFGMLTSIISSQFTHKLLKFSGVVVVLLGLVMLNRGMVLTGTTFDFNGIPSIGSNPSPEIQSDVIQVTPEGFQEIRMNVTRAGWEPDTFVLKKGVPVRWIINGIQITSCNKAIQVPSLGLKFDIKPGLQTIEFTPTEAGTIRWSCWMGMIQGVFIVKDGGEVNASSQDSGSIGLQANSLKGGGGCGGGGSGGCGGSGGGCGGGCGGGGCGCGG
jgi:sulfite exporter TauE/SafE